MYGNNEGNDVGMGSTTQGHVLVTGGGSGAKGTPASNKLEILRFDTSCAAPLGECAVDYTINVDPMSTAHFSALNEKTNDIYLCEVSTNKLKKFTYDPRERANKADRGVL